MSDLLEKLLDENETSKILQTKVKTLQHWRISGQGPEFIKMGRLVRYEASAIKRFIEANRRANTCNYGGQNV